MRHTSSEPQVRRHTLIVKGSIAEAVLAANERGIVLHDIKVHPRFNEVIAQADNECYPEIVQWFCDPFDDSAETAPAGTLMFYSEAREFGTRSEFLAGEIVPPAVTAPVTSIERLLAAYFPVATSTQRRA